MKKLLILATLALFCIPFLRCRKEQSSRQQSADAILITNARNYFNDSILTLIPEPTANPRISSPKSPVWEAAKAIETPMGKAVVVPVHYSRSLHIRANFAGKKLFDLNELTHLLIYQDVNHRYHAELVIAFPDSTALQTNRSGFTGILFVEDWSGNRLLQYKYAPDGSTLQSTPAQAQTGKGAAILPISKNAITPDIVFTTCYEIEGYNYTEGDSDNDYAWSEPAGCSSAYYPVTQSLAPIGGPSVGIYDTIAWLGSRLPTVNIAPPDAPIENIKAYFKCFTNSPAVDHSYTVTICVAQPVAGTRSPWSFTSGGPAGSSAAKNPFNVGHTFLIFSENSAGTIITRNVGFYPVGIVNPLYPSDQGVLDDNEKTGYNISLTYNVSNTQFFAILNYAALGNNPGYFYDLNTNNCTTFVLHALAAGGVSLSSRQGSWPGGGHGYDPGDLGEDIRSMTLPANARRNTALNPHPNQGNCN